MPNEWIPIIVIIVYLAGVTVTGIYFGGRNRGGKDWAVAGGGMGLWMVAVGVAGTRIGGAGTYGVAGNVMSGGVWYAWWYGISTFIAMLLVGSLYAIPYRRLQLHTVGEIFQKRFGNTRCQTMTSFCVQTEYLIVNVIEAYVIGIILTSLLGWPMSVTVCVAAVVLISYVSIGGLRAAAAANLIHCVVIVGGLLLIAILGIDKLGGWQQIVNSVGAHLANTPDSGPEESTWWAFFGGGSGAIIGMIFSTAIHSPAASVYTNYASSCRSEKMVLPAFLLAGLIAGLMPLLAGLIGVETLAMFGVDRGFDGYKNIAMLATTINPYIGGLALAAILAAVISSGGPILLASATMLVRDWGWFATDSTDAGQLRAYRLATVCYGTVAAFLAWLWSESDAGISILDVLLFGFAMVVPPAIAVGFLIYWRRTTESAAFYGMLAGYVAGLVWYGVIRWAIAVDFVAVDTDAAWRHWLQYFFVHNGKGIDPSYLTTLIPLLLIPALSLLQAPETERSEAFYRRLRRPTLKESRRSACATRGDRHRHRHRYQSRGAVDDAVGGKVVHNRLDFEGSGRNVRFSRKRPFNPRKDVPCQATLVPFSVGTSARQLGGLAAPHLEIDRSKNWSASSFVSPCQDSKLGKVIDLPSPMTIEFCIGRKEIAPSIGLIAF